MYGINDVIKITEAFSNISENRDNPEEFLHSINTIKEQ